MCFAKRIHAKTLDGLKAELDYEKSKLAWASSFMTTLMVFFTIWTALLVSYVTNITNLAIAFKIPVVGSTKLEFMFFIAEAVVMMLLVVSFVLWSKYTSNMREIVEAIDKKR